MSSRDGSECFLHTGMPCRGREHGGRGGRILSARPLCWLGCCFLKAADAQSALSFPIAIESLILQFTTKSQICSACNLILCLETSYHLVITK